MVLKIDVSRTLIQITYASQILSYTSTFHV